MGQTLKGTTRKAMKVGSKSQNNGSQIYCLITVKMFCFLLTKQKKTNILKKIKSQLNLGGKCYPFMAALCKIPQIVGQKEPKKNRFFKFRIILASNEEPENKGFTKDNVLYLKLF